MRCADVASVGVAVVSVMPSSCAIASLSRPCVLSKSHRSYPQIAARLHAILLFDSGQNAEAVSTILHIYPKTLKRWATSFVVGGEDALTTLTYRAAMAG